jgi:hypothetical protein
MTMFIHPAIMDLSAKFTHRVQTSFSKDIFLPPGPENLCFKFDNDPRAPASPDISYLITESP